MLRATADATHIGAALADRGEVDLPLPPCEERTSQRKMLRLLQLRISGDDGERFLPGLLQDRAIAEEGSGLELGQPGLARPEELPGAAKLQIHLSDPKPILTLHHR